MEVEGATPQGHTITCDAILFVIDEISPADKTSITGDPDTIVGHFVLMKAGKEIYSLPPARIKRNQAILLDGIIVKTKFTLKYNN
jgi:hypothetical protein